MSLWKKTDTSDGKPKYLSDTDKSQTIGIDVVETTDSEAASRGLKSPGWVKYRTYTDGQGNTRHKSEILVAMRTFNADSNSTLSDDLGLINTDYPIPGSGTYRTAAVALSGVSYADIGTPATLTGGITTVDNSIAGLYRSKYDGNFTIDALDTVSQYDLNWFTGKTPLKSIADEFLSWGAQDDGPGLGESLFSIEWKGYIKLPTTQKWNFYVESDDTCAVWLGDEAITGFSAANCLVSSSNKGLPGNASTSRSSKSLTMDNTKYYPIRIWFSEFTGGCKFQIYALGENGSKLNGDDIVLAYNDTTKGFNS